MDKNVPYFFQELNSVNHDLRIQKIRFYLDWLWGFKFTPNAYICTYEYTYTSICSLTAWMLAMGWLVYGGRSEFNYSYPSIYSIVHIGRQLAILLSLSLSMHRSLLLCGGGSPASKAENQDNSKQKKNVKNYKRLYRLWRNVGCLQSTYSTSCSNSHIPIVYF